VTSGGAFNRTGVKVVPIPRITPALLPEDSLSIRKASNRLERDLIQKALELTGGNRTQAAKILEISRPNLLAKIKEYELEKK